MDEDALVQLRHDRLELLEIMLSDQRLEMSGGEVFGAGLPQTAEGRASCAAAKALAVAFALRS
jgi:hypothetical protein